jgi:hypothetical protein
VSNGLVGANTKFAGRVSDLVQRLAGRLYSPYRYMSLLPHAGKEPVARLLGVGFVTLQLLTEGPVFEGRSNEK